MRRPEAFGVGAGGCPWTTWGPQARLGPLSYPSSRCLPRPADSTENPMIYLCPGAAFAQAAGKRIHSVPEREERGRKGREKEIQEGGRERQASLLHPGAPSRPLSSGPHILRNLSHHRFIWAVEDPITYNKQFRLSLSESLSKLAT